MKRGWHQGFVGKAGSSSQCAGCNLSKDQAHLGGLKWAAVTVHIYGNQAAVTIYTWGNQQLTQTSVLFFLQLSLFFFLSEPMSCVAKVGLELDMQLMIPLKSWYVCLYGPSDNITGVYHKPSIWWGNLLILLYIFFNLPRWLMAHAFLCVLQHTKSMWDACSHAFVP